MTTGTTHPEEAVDDDQLLDTVLELFDAADREARPLPGRPALLEQLPGVKENQLKKAIAVATAVHRRQRLRPAAAVASAGVPTASVSSAGDPAASPGETTDQPTPADQNRATAAPTLVPWSTRLVTWTGFIFGAATSIAANVLHTWLPADHQPPHWSPGLPPQIGATVWPVSLIFAVEVLARIHWPTSLWWGIPRYLGTSTVALGSWLISYNDVRDVLLAWNYQPLAATVGPLVLDGLMIVCAFALLANSHTRTHPQHSRVSPTPEPANPHTLADAPATRNPMLERVNPGKLLRQFAAIWWLQPRSASSTRQPANQPNESSP